MADDQVKVRLLSDSWPDGPKTKTTKIAGLAHLRHLFAARILPFQYVVIDPEELDLLRSPTSRSSYDR